MTMPGIQYHDPGGEIDIAFALYVGERGILRRLGKERAHHV